MSVPTSRSSAGPWPLTPARSRPTPSSSPCPCPPSRPPSAWSGTGSGAPLPVIRAVTSSLVDLLAEVDPVEGGPDPVRHLVDRARPIHLDQDVAPPVEVEQRLCALPAAGRAVPERTRGVVRAP